MKRLIFLTILTLQISYSKASDSLPAIDYTISMSSTDEDTAIVTTANYDFPRWSASTGLLLSADPYEVGTRMLLRFETEYVIPKIGAVSLRADKNIIKSFDDQYYWLFQAKDIYVKTSNEVKPYHSYDLTLQFFLHDKEKIKKRKITYQYSYSGGYGYDHTGRYSYDSNKYSSSNNFKCNIPTRSIISLRSGILHYRTILNNYYASNGFLAAESGAVIYDAPAIPINSGDLENIYLTNYYSNTLYLGLSIQRTTNLSYAYKSYSGTRKRNSNFYIDVFLKNISRADELKIKSTNASYNILHNNKGGFKSDNMGFRIGYHRIMYLSNHSAISLRLEGGQKAGITNIYNDESFFNINSVIPLKFFEGSISYTWGS